MPSTTCSRTKVSFQSIAAQDPCPSPPCHPEIQWPPSKNHSGDKRTSQMEHSAGCKAQFNGKGKETKKYLLHDLKMSNKKGTTIKL